MNEIIERDAHEFGAYVKAGGWRLGLLVARNVQMGVGDRSVSRRDRAARVDGKVSAREFGRVAGTTKDRIGRYLAAWEAAAEAGFVPAAASLSPGSNVELDVDKLPAWGEYYDASKAGGYNGGEERTPTAAGVAKAIEKLPDDALSAVGEAIERQRVERQLYPDRPRPTVEVADRRQRQQEVQRRKEEPSEALVRLGTRIGDSKAALRALVSEYQDFKALVDDEEILDLGRDRMIAFQAAVDVAIAEATTGSIEDALARLQTEPEEAR